MSNTPQEHRHFAFVIDGVVATTMSIASGPEWNQFTELYASRPVIIEVPADLENFGEGYLWDGTSFSAPPNQ